MKVPFTPGIIPKEKGRIAASIGNAISTNLMNREVLERTLLSDEMLSKIDGAIAGYVDTQKNNEETLRAYLLHYLKEEDLEKIQANVSSDLSAQIQSALSGANLGTKIASIAVGHVIEKVRKGLLKMIGADQFLSLVAAPVESMLAKNINEMLATHSQEMVETLIEDQIANFLEVPMKDLFSGHDRQIAEARKTILSLYTTLVTEQLPRILETINISGIVENRINEMDVKETEKLILEVMKKELRAIVWLGALLGLVMGAINIFL